MLNVKALYTAYEKGELKAIPVKLQGWVKTNRNNGTIGFIEFNDGSAFKGVQIVYEKIRLITLLKLINIALERRLKFTEKLC